MLRQCVSDHHQHHHHRRHRHRHHHDVGMHMCFMCCAHLCSWSSEHVRVSKQPSEVGSPFTTWPQGPDLQLAAVPPSRGTAQISPHNLKTKSPKLANIEQRAYVEEQ